MVIVPEPSPPDHPGKPGPSIEATASHCGWDIATSGKPFFVYILASKRNGTLYIGSTDDLPKRIWRHKSGEIKGFTSKYSVRTLVWFEVHETRGNAFTRERRMKEWRRDWKLKLIEEMNPEWNDLYETLNQ